MPNITAFAPTGNDYVDGLLSGAKWSTTSLTFSFPTSGSFYGSGYGDGENTYEFEAFNAVQRTAVNKVLANFQSVTALNFRLIRETSSQHADLRFAESDLPPTAWAYEPTSLAVGGDVWLNNSRNMYDAPTKGGYAYLTLLHEIGHSLGLKHAHDVEGVFGALPANHDSMEYTVMSYCSFVGAPTDTGYCNEPWGYAQSLMMDDISALQRMYGADYTTNAADSTYRWSASTGEMFINGMGQGRPGGNQILLTVWDGGGNDTYDLSNYGSDVRINLAPGAWTRTSTAQLAELRGDGSKIAVGNIANARLHQGDTRSLIENASGGSGDDVILGNSARNNLRGGEGHDVLTGGAGQDFVWGGNGADIFNFDALTHSRAGASARDSIRDFNYGADRIDVCSIDADRDYAPGNQTFTFIGNGNFSGADGQLRYGWLNYAGTESDRTVVSADVNGDKLADFQVALVGLHTLSANDFIL